MTWEILLNHPEYEIFSEYLVTKNLIATAKVCIKYLLIIYTKKLDSSIWITTKIKYFINITLLYFSKTNFELIAKL